MRLLAFDTAGPAISGAAGQDGALLSTRRELPGRGQAERILPMLGEVLAEAGWAWSAIELVVVTEGPGNFTGLRTGIGVARALALALDCPVLGIGTLELLAEAGAARAPGNARPIHAVLDARRGELYAQRFAADRSPLSPPALVPATEPLADGAAPRLLVGDAAALQAVRGPCDDGVIEVAPDARYLAAAAWRRLASGAERGARAMPKPVYLRRPDARLGAGASLLPARH